MSVFSLGDLKEGVFIKRSPKEYQDLPSCFLRDDVMDEHEQQKLKAFGDRVRELRLQLTPPLSQEKLALVSGLARSYLGDVERGNRNIAILNIHRLAEALGVEPARLLEPPTSLNNKKTDCETSTNDISHG